MTRSSMMACAVLLLAPIAAATAQAAHPGASTSLLGAAAEYIRISYLQDVPSALLAVDPRQAPGPKDPVGMEKLHDRKALAGVARRGSIAVVSADSARACAGPRDPKHPCGFSAFVGFSAPFVKGDSATVVGFLRAVFPPKGNRGTGMLSVTFSLLLVREGGKWHVAGKRELGGK